MKGTVLERLLFDRPHKFSKFLFYSYPLWIDCREAFFFCCYFKIHNASFLSNICLVCFASQIEGFFPQYSWPH